MTECAQGSPNPVRLLGEGDAGSRELAGPSSLAQVELPTLFGAQHPSLVRGVQL